MATIDGRTLAHKTLQHIRIQAVGRVIEDGEPPSEVMRSFGLCRTTLYPWLREFKDKGWGGAGGVYRARTETQADPSAATTGETLDLGPSCFMPTGCWT